MEKYLSVIKKCTLFQNLKDEEIIKIINSTNTKLAKYKKDEFVIQTDDEPNEFGIVLEGSVNIQKLDYNGNLNIMTNVNKSELFGEAFVYAGVNKYLVSVCCNEDCLILLMNKDYMLNLINLDIQLFKKFNDNMLKCMSKKLVNLTYKIDILTGQSIREKVLIYLGSLSEGNESKNIEIPFNREQLADFLCVNRSSLSRELSKMRDEGIIDFYKNTFKKLI